MAKSTESFLKEIVLLPELRNNTIAYAFAKHPQIAITKKESFFDNVASYYRQYKGNVRPDSLQIEADKEVDELNEWQGADLRIKKVRLKSIRGYPDSDIPFGVDFADESGNPKSMIILGSNGSGKSSLYDSMEYIYCKEVGEAKLRDYGQTEEKDVDYLRFLEHKNNGKQRSFCEVSTIGRPTPFSIDGSNIPKSIRESINPDTHFVSDYDIYKFGRFSYENGKDRSFHNHLAKSLGLKDLLDFEFHVKSFIGYRRLKESRRVGELKKSIQTHNELIITNNKALAKLKEELEALSKGKLPQNEEQTKAKARLLIEQIRHFSPTLYRLDLNDFSKNLSEFLKAYRLYQTQETKSSGEEEVEFLNAGLKLMDSHENCPFCDDSQKSKDAIIIEAKEKVERLQAFNKILRELNIIQSVVLTKLEKAFRNLHLLKSNLREELEAIKDNFEFAEVIVLDNKLLKLVSELLSEEIFIGVEKGWTFGESARVNRDSLELTLRQYEDKIDKLINQFNDELEENEKSRQRVLDEIGARLKPSDGENSAIGRIAVVKESIDRLTKQINEAKGNIELEKVEQLNLSALIDEFEDVKKETRTFIEHFSVQLNKEVDSVFGPVRDVVQRILSTYFNLDRREIELRIVSKPIHDVETGELMSNYLAAEVELEDNTIMDVSRYLNTFHYRLFCTMVGVATAIASRIKTGINMPLVMDDVFYASDFENRHAVENFIEKLFQIFRKYSPELPLQLIMLTHDRLVFESIMNASHEDNLEEEKIAFARLFPPSEGEQNKDFINLVYCLPHRLPMQIMNTVYTVGNHE